ncbi:tyrosine-type recombinase/integrase [Nioella ostreopsis]|uniref:tyrosine-type recombinase/integrase n=1 Tax=Nioella ostreopsis TaxID=2448479 RepID=UPI000FDA34CA|nr:site-specific integrase [Nioella ostreopsis]
MPKESKSLSPLAVKRLPPGVHAVGGVPGLHLQVRETGGRSWLLRAKIGGRRREMGLGPYPEVGLADARAEAARARAVIRSGGDPIAERKAVKAALAGAARRGKTFSEVLEEYAAEKLTELKEERYRAQWLGAVRKYAVPVLNNMPVQDIGLEEVLRVLSPIWSEKTATATKLRGRLNQILSFATVKGYRDGVNPAAWKDNLSQVLPSPDTVADREHYPAVQLKDLERWWCDLQTREGMGPLAIAFQAMTVSRSGLIRFATWDEVDFEAALWTVQPGRRASKIPPRNRGGRPHRVPLTDDMISLLKSVPRFQGSSLIFPGSRGRELSDGALGALMDAMHVADVKRGGPGFVDRETKKRAVPHGFRSTFRVWVSDHTTFDGDMAEVALLHKVGSKVAQAYDRSDRLEKRKEMMNRWVKVLKTGA